MRRKSLQPFSVAKIYCRIFGHKLQISRNITGHIHEYKCANCEMEMTDTANGFLATLTPKFKETNEYLAQVYRKRRRHYASAS